MKTLLHRTFVFAGTMLLAQASSAQLWSYDFENGILPAGWTQQTNATDGGWQVGNSGQLSSADFPITAHTTFVATNEDACNCDKSNEWLKTHVFSLVGISDPYLVFSQFYWEASYQGATESAEVHISTNGGVSFTLLHDVAANADMISWEDRSISLSAYANMANLMLAFRYDDDAGWTYGWCMDDVAIVEPQANDAALIAVTPVGGTTAAYGASGSPINIGGTIKNMGVNTITTIDVAYDAGAGTVTNTLNGLNIPSFGTYEFTHPTPFVIPSVGTHNITVWVDLTGDGTAANDQQATAVQGVSFMPVHNPVIEEATGTWCGWCPRGTVYMDSLHGEEPDAILIAVHNDDPMDFGAYDVGIASVPGFQGYPGIAIDRTEVQDPSDIFTYYDNYRSNFGFADVGVAATFNSGTRQCDVTVSAHFAASLSGDHRFAVVFTEDNVTGTGDGSNVNAQDYDQVNYYSFQSQNLALDGAGHDWQAEENPVDATEMVYDFVARTLLPSFQGQVGSLPTTIAAGSTHQYSFSYTIPVGYNDANMRVIGLLLDGSSGAILNANQIQGVSGATGTSELERTGLAMELYPNPASDVIQLTFTLVESDQITVAVADLMGREAMHVTAETFVAGSHQVRIDVSKLPAGAYNLILAGSEGMSAKTFIKN